jgi:ribulose-phosphate 3-epimerase
MPVLIAPSIFAADFGILREQIAAVEQGGADLLHVDIMDGHFVPNLTMGPVVVEAIRRSTRLPLDVHLMMTDPDLFLQAFVDAGASRINVHVEALPHLHRTIQTIKKLGMSAGVALNPATPVGTLEEIAPDLDHVLVMSVNPGFSGQTFIPRSESKIRGVRDLLARTASRADIGVDGGIDTTNAGRVAGAGATMLVVGSALFRQPDLARAIRDLRAAADMTVPQ